MSPPDPPLMPVEDQIDSQTRQKCANPTTTRNLLKLQPVFPTGSNAQDSEGGEGGHGNLTSEDLWRMWNVATKAKSSIEQGRRLENLSWRLWYSSTKQSSTNTNGPSGHSSPPVNIRMASTYSAILSEIQQAAMATETDGKKPDSARSLRSTSDQSPSTPPHSPPIMLLARTPLLSDASALGLGEGGTDGLSREDNHPGSTNKYLARKKKKNIERYLRRYQRRLGDIDEQNDDEGEGDQTRDSCDHADDERMEMDGSMDKLTEESIASAKAPSEEQEVDKMFQRMTIVTASPSLTSPPAIPISPPLSDPNGEKALMRRPSLLTAALQCRSPKSHQNSCELAVTPPSRPSAPVPFSNNIICDDDHFEDCL